MTDEAARDLRELLGAHDKYWVENRGAADHIVYEYNVCDRRVDSSTIEAVMSSRHGRHVSGLLVDARRATVRVRYTHDACAEPSAASNDRDLSDIGDVKIAGVSGDDLACVALAARKLGACTATGVRPSFEVEMETGGCQLFACKVSQWCGLSLHRCGIDVCVHMGEAEVSTRIEFGQRAAKRARR